LYFLGGATGALWRSNGTGAGSGGAAASNVVAVDNTLYLATASGIAEASNGIAIGIAVNGVSGAADLTAIDQDVYFVDPDPRGPTFTPARVPFALVRAGRDTMRPSSAG
jgi:hypothetical protein